MRPRRILVTDGNERVALALVRSLGRAGHHLTVGAARARSLAAASRHASAEVVLPDPLAGGEGYAAAVLAAAGRHRCDTLIPVSEASLYAILERRERFGGLLLPFPGIVAFRRLSDKAEVAAAAPACGLAVPRQVRLDTRQGDRTPARALPFPVVVKPARSVAATGEGSIKLGVLHAADAAALDARLDALPESAYPVLVQQRIVGPGIGVFLLRWDGATRAAFAHRRLREKPPSGGVSVYRESAPLDPGLRARCEALLAAFDWRGVAMVELKLDGGSGTPYLMEVNGRFWGSLQLAIDAGVDFPNLLLDAALGVGTPPVTRWRLGVRSRWWWGDVDHLLALWRHSRQALDLPAGAPGRWRTLAAFLRLWWPGDRNEVFRAADPRPFLRESAQWIRGVLGR